MREAIKNAYKGAKWFRKVQAMPDPQVVAIFKNLQQQKKV
jgi:hypothetical protein